jgi:hypothetical protein
MKSFRQFMTEQDQINERLIRKGAVAVYAAQGKKHGNNAARRYRDAKNALTIGSRNDLEDKIDALTKAIVALAEGLSSTRDQIGSVSAQITALTVLK